VGLRHPGFASESELVRHRLAGLVLERQKLRDERASEAMLEQNRLDIVQAQQDLARALMSEHDAASAA
jgi:hypothetical protein